MHVYILSISKVSNSSMGFFHFILFYFYHSINEEQKIDDCDGVHGVYYVVRLVIGRTSCRMILTH